MLERLIAFGLVAAVLFGLATYLRDDDAPGEDCRGAVVCATPEPREPLAPACPENGCPPDVPKALSFRPASRDGDDEKEEKDDKRKDREKDEKRGKGRRGKD